MAARRIATAEDLVADIVEDGSVDDLQSGSARDCWAGIDPGLTGAIAVLRASGPEVFDMPTLRTSASRSEIDVPRFRDLLESLKLGFVTIEQQCVMPGQGVASTGKTMQGYGMLLGVLYGLRMRFEVVRPQDWKRAAGIPPKADKGASLLFAGRLFPEVELRGPNGGAKDGRAEALLIAQHGLIRRGGASSKEAPKP